MTDAELDEAVARECLGWTEHEKPPCWVDGNGYRMAGRGWNNDGNIEWFSPTTDARDAERVWDWLVKKVGTVSVMRLDYGGALGTSVLHGAKRPLDLDDVDNWKRALALAALEVARD